jgi:hypothetical protein
MAARGRYLADISIQRFVNGDVRNLDLRPDRADANRGLRCQSARIKKLPETE